MKADEVQAKAFEIILHSGNARTQVHEAFQLMKDGNYEASHNKLETSNECLVRAHQAQTSMMQEYANGAAVPIDIIMVHAQDHLMTSMTLREVAIEMMSLYQKVDGNNEVKA